MASNASPLASLSQALPAPVLVRPSVPRTASSRSLPTKSTLPRVTLAFTSVPPELDYGVSELAKEAVRSNMVVVRGDTEPPVGHFVWGIERVPCPRPFALVCSYADLVMRFQYITDSFEERSDFRPGQMSISSNSDDFAILPRGVDRFTITVRYNRAIEGEPRDPSATSARVRRAPCRN